MATILSMILSGLTAVTVAASEWIVPESPPPVEFVFAGVIDLDRGGTVMLLPLSRDLVTEWVVPIGARIGIGDPVIVFDNTMAKRQVKQRTLDAEIADVEANQRELDNGDGMAALHQQQVDLEGQLAVAQATLHRASTVDADRLALAQAQELQTIDELARHERLHRLAEVRHQAGEITDAELVKAAQAVVDARRDLTLAATERERIAAPASRAEVARLQARVEELQAKLGVDADGKAVEGGGIRGRIAATTANQRREALRSRSRKEEAIRRLHEAERDAWDHTPLKEIVISGSKPLHLVFGPADMPAPEGAVRVGAPGAAAAWSEGKLRTSPGFGGVTLVRGKGRLRIEVPDGDCQVRIVLGDEVDWDGAVVSVATSGGGRRVLASPRRIDAKRPFTIEAEVTVAGDGLVIEIGDDLVKALRSPVAGIALPREWIAPGWKTGWSMDPAAYIAGPESFRLRGVVRQDHADLLRQEGAPVVPATDAIDRLRVGLATHEVTWRAVDGTAGVAKVANVIRQPIAPSLRADGLGVGTLDRFANEVQLSLNPADAARVRLGSEVVLRARVVPPAGVTVVPAHAVVEADERCFIRLAGQEAEEVAAVRVDGWWVVDRLIPGGTRLVPPDLPPLPKGERGARVPGEVVPGRSVPVVCEVATGRIAKMVEDGSEVSAGQIVVSLYNPWLEAKRDESDRRKQQAVESHGISAEQRRVSAERAATTQHDQALIERIARLDLVEALEEDPLPVIRSTAANEKSQARLQIATDTLERAKALGDARILRQAEPEVERARLEAEGNLLDLVAARRGIDWLALRQAKGGWADAVAELAGSDLDARVARAEEKSSALQAELRLSQAMQGSLWEQAFNVGKDLAVPVSGRLFFREGWDDRTSTSSKFQKDFWVWRGMTVADVVDLGNLAFTAQVDESRAASLKPNAKVELVFPRLNHRRLTGSIEEVGKAVVTAADDDSGPDSPVLLRKVVSVRVSFAVPDDLRGRLVPGAKGELELP